MIDMRAHRYLIINFNKIGDTLLQTQIINGIKASQPESFIAVISSIVAHEVLYNNPKVSLLIKNDILPEKSVLNFFRYLKVCREIIKENKIDVIVCDRTNSTPVTALLMNLLSADTKIYSAPIKKIYYPLYQRLDLINQELDENASIISGNHGILRFLGCKETASVEIFPTDYEKQKALDFVLPLKKMSSKKLISLVPFSMQPATAWPTKNINKFLNLAKDRFNVLLFAHPNNLKDIKDIESFKHVFPVTNFNIRESSTVINETDILVSLDTGPSHLFETLNIPLLKINSARIPEHTWGYGDDLRYHFLQLKVDCGPCFSRHCKVAGHPCMNDITPEMVLHRIEMILTKSKDIRAGV